MAEGSFLGQSTDLRLVILALNPGFAILPSVTLKKVRHTFFVNRSKPDSDSSVGSNAGRLCNLMFEMK